MGTTKMEGGDAMKKRVVAMLLAACMMLALVGCGEKKTEEEPAPAPVEKEEPAPAPAPVPEPVPEPEPEPEPVPALPEHMNPLTGEEIDPEKINDRPVAVMFNNLKAAQPQIGQSTADIIYEIEAEGGITRMVGVYQSLDGVGTLGSIRSTRPYYLEVALGHDAMLVHAGASPEAYKNIDSWGVDNMDGVNGASDAQIFWRDAQRKKNAGYEHSMVTSSEKILEYLAKDKFRLEHKDGYAYTQNFAVEGTPENGGDAGKLTLRFSAYKTGTFTYDADSGLYMVGQYGGKYVDGATNEQVGVTNVLVLETEIGEIPGDKALRCRARMTGTGEGEFFCGGKSLPIKWSKADRNSQFVYTLEDGTPLTLGQGTSYVCIIDPTRSTLTVE